MLFYKSVNHGRSYFGRRGQILTKWCLSVEQRVRGATNISTEDEGRRQYVVQLKRDVNCCEDTYKVFVNNEERENDLTDNPCSPLCCKGGSYRWHDHGHEFHLVYNALSLTGVVGKHRLFVDDIDCNTGREFGEFFRRRGYQFIVFGFLILLAGVIWASVFRFLIHSTSVSVVGYAFIIGRFNMDDNGSYPCAQI